MNTIKCSYCAEEIDERFEICPLCDEPLPYVETQAKKKSKKALIIGGIVVVLALFFVWAIMDDDEETNYEDFPTFIQKFVTDEDFQFEHIKFPLTSINSRGVSINSKNEWHFLNSDEIFEGVKMIDGVEHQGHLFGDTDSDDYFYYECHDESGVIFMITFTKINGIWMLTDFLVDL